MSQTSEKLIDKPNPKPRDQIGPDHQRSPALAFGGGGASSRVNFKHQSPRENSELWQFRKRRCLNYPKQVIVAALRLSTTPNRKYIWSTALLIRLLTETVLTETTIERASMCELLQVNQPQPTMKLQHISKHRACLVPLATHGASTVPGSYDGPRS